MMNNHKKPLIVIGASAGGLKAIKAIIDPLPVDFNAPILIVQHMQASSDSTLLSLLSKNCQLPVQYALNGYEPYIGTLYLAPPDYHLRLDADGTMMTSNDDKVLFSRPSIDVLFDSVSQLKQFKVIAVVLTGANADGAAGAKKIQQYGGEVIAQAVETAEITTMPQATIDACGERCSVPLDQIGPMLWEKVKNSKTEVFN